MSVFIPSAAQLSEHYIDTLYSSFRNLTAPINPTDFTHNYGEILTPSVTKLLSITPLTNQDIFLDLGSGTGKVITQVFLQTDVKQAIGIEILPHLHQIALKAKKQMQQDLPKFFHHRELKFLLASFLEIPLNPATVVFINATCFGQELLLKLGEIIETTSSIHTVWCTRPISPLQRLRFKKSVRVEGSWDSVQCFLYRGGSD